VACALPQGHAVLKNRHQLAERVSLSCVRFQSGVSLRVHVRMCTNSSSFHHPLHHALGDGGANVHGVHPHACGPARNAGGCAPANNGLATEQTPGGASS
jgi:hypothetical protein